MGVKGLNKVLVIIIVMKYLIYSTISISSCHLTTLCRGIWLDCIEQFTMFESVRAAFKFKSVHFVSYTSSITAHYLSNPHLLKLHSCWLPSLSPASFSFLSPLVSPKILSPYQDQILRNKKVKGQTDIVVSFN